MSTSLPVDRGYKFGVIDTPPRPVIAFSPVPKDPRDLHMQNHCRLLTLSAAAVLMLAAPVYAQRAARILRVEERRPPMGEAAASPSFNALHLDKFSDERIDADGHLFFVHWQPPEGGSPAGTVVRFEYRQEDPKVVKKLEVAYPIRTNERRRATFKITGKALRQGGIVTAWRVRILEDGKVLAEDQSESWR